METFQTWFSTSDRQKRKEWIKWMLRHCFPDELKFVQNVFLDPASVLPRELTAKVLPYLNLSSANIVLRLSRVWHSLVKECDELWVAVVQRNGLMERTWSQYLKHSKDRGAFRPGFWYDLARQSLKENIVWLQQFQERIDDACIIDTGPPKRAHTRSINTVSFCKQDPSFFATSSATESKVWRWNGANKSANKIAEFQVGAISMALDSFMGIFFAGDSLGDILCARYLDDCSTYRKATHLGSITCLYIEGAEVISGSQDTTVVITPISTFPNTNTPMFPYAQRTVTYRHSFGPVVDLKMHNGILAVLSSVQGDSRLDICRRVKIDGRVEFIRSMHFEGDSISLDSWEKSLSFLVSWVTTGVLDFDSVVNIAEIRFAGDRVTVASSGIMRPSSSFCEFKIKCLMTSWFDATAVFYSHEAIRLVHLAESDLENASKTMPSILHAYKYRNVYSNRDGLLALVDGKGNLYVASFLDI
ncbi:hypothetical protein BC829DRAFT_385092 [Chytridium lagenaria]|nr:hypothetical protein BC829DRAFT_385092 [Chytridium lagenaria]